MSRSRRRIFVVGLAITAMAAMAASTAYACVNFKGNATVTGSTRASNLMTGSGAHSYCSAATSPKNAAAGTTGSITFAFAPATSCVSSTNTLSPGTYDVRLRNVGAATGNTAWNGKDVQAGGTGWTQNGSSGCFTSTTFAANNRDLGDLVVTTTTSTNGGSASWPLPSGLSNNDGTLNDASIFCVGKKDAAGNVGGTADGFLAPFRVSTI